MNKIKTTLFLVVFLAVLVLPSVSSAQSAADFQTLQTQVQQLITTVQQLMVTVQNLRASSLACNVPVTPSTPLTPPTIITPPNVGQSILLFSPTGNLYVGRTWFLNLFMATPYQPVYVCGWQSQTANPSNEDAITTCTPAGDLGFATKTSGYRTWSASGSFVSKDVGYWKEWVFVGGTIIPNGSGGQTVSGGAQSNKTPLFNVSGSTITLPPPSSSGNFITLSPSSLTIPTGFANSVVITAPNSTSPVAISVERGTLPGSVTVSQSITAINNATGLTAVAVGVTVGSGTPVGTYSFTIIGTKSGQVQRQPITLTVTGTTPSSSGETTTLVPGPSAMELQRQLVALLESFGTPPSNWRTSNIVGYTAWQFSPDAIYGWTGGFYWVPLSTRDQINQLVASRDMAMSQSSYSGVVTPPPSSSSLPVSPASLTFSAQSGGQPQNQQLTLTSCPSPSCTIVKYLTNNPLPASIEWFTVGLPNNSTPRAVTVSVNPSNLPPGTYTGDIVVSANSQTVIVPVTITVTAATTNTLSATPYSLNFSAQQGGAVSPSVSSIMLTNYSLVNGTISRVFTGGSTGVNWLVWNNPNYLSPYWMSVVPNNANISPGIYTANIVITSNSQTVTIPVTFTVTP